MTPTPLCFPAVLASASPRRQEFLRKVIRDFEVDAADLDEDSLTITDPVATAETLALAKGRHVAARHPNSVVIAGDTVVALEERQFAKPVDASHACEMLRALSGQRHRVITALAVVWPTGEVVQSDTAWVRFRELSDEEILAYVESGEPMDKAGAYAIQGGAAPFVAELEGDMETVIGLPTRLLRSELMANRLFV